MTGMQRLRLSMLKGWTIPRPMEWLFWPMGYMEWRDSVAVIGQHGDGAHFVAAAPGPQPNIVPLSRRFFEVRQPGRPGFWEMAQR